MTVHPEPPETTRIAARMETSEGDFDVVTESNYSLDATSTPWLPPAVSVAMRHQWDLEAEGPVDTVALDGIDAAQKVIAGWYPRQYGEVPVSAQLNAGEVADPRGVGCFFSGGVDSFYSAITQAERITHLIFVHGFDIKIDNDDLAAKSLEAAREAAADLGKPLIEVKTTIRSAFGDHLKMQWGELYHGPCLAHVGLALAPHLSAVVIPSSYSREELHPWGSHPDLDPLWSSSAVTFEHHELEADRFEKIRRISRSQTAMNHLRVCWMNRKGTFNCGRCAKCIRTKIGLMVAGVESPMLPGPIDPKVVRRMVAGRSERIFIRGAIRAMHDAEIQDPELDKALRVAIRRSYFWQLLMR